MDRTHYYAELPGKATGRFLVYWQRHKHVSVKEGVFLAIKKCGAIIVCHIVKR